MSASAKNCGFIDGGHDIACAAIRRQVKQEFAERWQRATWRERWKLRIEIDREVERRVAREAPPGALY